MTTSASVVESAPLGAARAGELGSAAGRGEVHATRQRLIEPDVLAALVTATDQPQESQGHVGNQGAAYIVRVAVSRDAVAAYLAWQSGSVMPEGVWLVARHSWPSSSFAGTTGESIPPNHARPAGDAIPPDYAMYKGARGWEYGAMDSKGWRIRISEGACQDCHTPARSDSVFGPLSPVMSSTTSPAPAVPPRRARHSPPNQ